MLILVHRIHILCYICIIKLLLSNTDFPHLQTGSGPKVSVIVVFECIYIYIYIADEHYISEVDVKTIYGRR